jgi:hypothetical protein
MSEDERIPTEIWVTGTLRRCQAQGISVYIARKGAPAAGTVLVKIAMKAGARDALCRVFSQSRDGEGRLGWLDPFDGAAVEEAKADDYIRRSVKRDPDVWVVEVEDPSGKNPFEGKIL